MRRGWICTRDDSSNTDRNQSTEHRRGGLHPAGSEPMTTAVLRHLPLRDVSVRSRERSNVLLVLICLAQFMVILDVSIVNVALPSIRGGLHFGTTGLQWVVNAYTITFGGFLLLGGRLADLLGRRRVFLARHRPVQLRFAAVRARELARAADRRARTAGSRRRGALPREPGDHHDLVRRGHRAQPRARRLGRDGRARRRLRSAARRTVDPGSRLAGDLLDQRPDRRRGDPRRPADHPREPARGHPSPLRRCRRDCSSRSG